MTTARPIIFSAPMVRALLAGSKTQTRRVVKSLCRSGLIAGISADGHPIERVVGVGTRLLPCPYGKPGDQLWVRETFAIVPRTAYRCSEGVQQMLRPDDDHDAAIFRAGWDRSRGGFRWRPSIHMPRWASRILLEVTDVRVERLQDISEADALAEGIEYLPRIGGFGLPDGSHFHVFDPRISYWSLWDAINGPGAVEANPWVWCVSLERRGQS